MVSFSGCVENADTAISSAKYTINEDMFDELTILAEQLEKAAIDYDKASNEYNDAIENGNDFIYEYNDMNYFERTSSNTVNRKSSLEQEVRRSARNLIIQCDIMDSQIDDVTIFMESNKEDLIDIDSQFYYEFKNGLVAAKASVKSDRSVATEALYK